MRCTWLRGKLTIPARCGAARAFTPGNPKTRAKDCTYLSRCRSGAPARGRPPHWGRVERKPRSAGENPPHCQWSPDTTSASSRSHALLYHTVPPPCGPPAPGRGAGGRGPLAYPGRVPHTQRRPPGGAPANLLGVGEKGLGDEGGEVGGAALLRRRGGRRRARREGLDVGRGGHPAVAVDECRRQRRHCALSRSSMACTHHTTHSAP